MRASTPTKLSLLDWAKIIGIHPLHFAQVAYIRPSTGTPLGCSQIFFQYPWQNSDAASREEIAQAIAQAEELVEQYLGFRLSPSWEVDEWRPSEPHFQPELYALGYRNYNGLSSIVKANWGHFITGGIETKTLVDAEAPIVYTDADSDDYEETATVVVTVTAGLDPCELAVYYPGHDGEDGWEIKPVRSSISGTTATITFRREQAVAEILLEGLDPAGADPSEDSDFLTEVDVYRHWTDPQLQAVLMWEPGSSCNCGQSGCALCSYTVQNACLHLRGDPKHSLAAYTPAEWDSDTNSFSNVAMASSRRPDLVRLYYYSGLRNKRKDCTRDMDDYWKRVIAHFAAALLDRPPCDCSVNDWEYWREDLSLVQGSDASGTQTGIYRIEFNEIENPFGTRRGMLYAWRAVKKLGIGQAVMT